jgi:hypothetical protein
MRVPAKEVFGIDWTNLEAVKKLADKFGSGMSVYKHPDRRNYNITHTSREKDREVEAFVVYRTGGTL